MTKDIVKITIFDNRVELEYLGELEVSSWSEQVLTEHGWKCFSDGYVPNDPEAICKYLMGKKGYFREEILYFQRLIDNVDLELMKQCKR